MEHALTFFIKLKNPLNLPGLFDFMALPVALPADNNMKPAWIESSCREEPGQGSWMQQETRMI